LLSDGDLRKQKNHAKRGDCFLFSGLKLRDGERSEHPRQLHVKAENNHPRKGVFVFEKTPRKLAF
jgi:hypothetical protein